ncbi:hypothetical protein HYW17_00205 [Candidatus Uhrbacteria bacterium]|nr:hypothetical protein [Candidatus Uhrbacteria bacterium]
MNLKTFLRRENLVRIYLLLFLAGILTWVITSSAGFYAGTHQDMPRWMANWPPLNRVLFLNALNNIYYLAIALGLFVEFLRPKIEFRWSGHKGLTVLGTALIINAAVVGYNNDFFFGRIDRLIDTIIYGFGFGTLFLLEVPQRTRGLTIALWARLIEAGGPATGYFLLPALLSQWQPGQTLYHLTQGPAFMFSSYFWLTDNITAIGSLLGVAYLLYKFRFKPFWIVSFFIGAIIIGYGIARYVMGNF